MFSRNRESARVTRVRELLRGLPMPEPWSLEAYIETVAAQRGRRIVCKPLPANAPPGLCGLWLAMPDHDVIVHEVAAVREHQELIICHELAHMQLSHDSDPTLAMSRVAGIDTAKVVRARGFSTYARHEEFEAELLARSVLARRSGGPDQFQRIVESF